MRKRRLQVIAAYIPVLHRGYIEFFESYPEAKTLYLFTEDLLTEEDYLRKDLRALDADKAKLLISGLGRFNSIKKLDRNTLGILNDKCAEIIMPDDDISHRISKIFNKSEVHYNPVFLRWDRRSIKNINQDKNRETITGTEFNEKLMRKAMEKAGQSSDIWRRVGAVLITREGKTRSAANKGEPSIYTPWMEGDPRNLFNRGVAIEMSVFMHAEANLIAESARRGINLSKAKLYVSTYPCPACAKLIAHSGIDTLYYTEGYAVLDGERVMKNYGVKIIKVDIQPPKDNSATWVPYTK